MMTWLPAPYKQAQLPIEQRIQDFVGAHDSGREGRARLDLYSGAGTDAMEHPIKLLDHVRNHTHAAVDSKILPDNATQLWGALGVGAIQRSLIPISALGKRDPRLGDQAQPTRHLPALFFEKEGVHGSQSFEETVFPAPIGLGTTWDTDLAKQTGATIAAEMRCARHSNGPRAGARLGAGTALGPHRGGHGGGPRNLTGQLGLAYVQGMQGDSLASDHNIIAEPKHFARPRFARRAVSIRRRCTSASARRAPSC